MIDTEVGKNKSTTTSKRTSTSTCKKLKLKVFSKKKSAKEKLDL